MNRFPKKRAPLPVNPDLREHLRRSMQPLDEETLRRMRLQTEAIVRSLGGPW